MRFFNTIYCTTIIKTLFIGVRLSCIGYPVSGLFVGFKTIPVQIKLVEYDLTVTFTG